MLIHIVVVGELSLSFHELMPRGHSQSLAMWASHKVAHNSSFLYQSMQDEPERV